MDISEVAFSAKVNKETVKRWCQKGKLRATKVNGAWHVESRDYLLFSIGRRKIKIEDFMVALSEYIEEEVKKVDRFDDAFSVSQKALLLRLPLDFAFIARNIESKKNKK